jgi:hypothetical protein
MSTISIQFERNELRELKARAARQLRTPENHARFLILKQMGFVADELSVNGDESQSQAQPVPTQNMVLA